MMKPTEFSTTLTPPITSLILINVMNYSSSIIANPSNKTPLLNNGYFVSSNNDKIQGTYLGSAIQSGIAITTDFYTPNSVSNIFNEISYSATIRNSNNVNINPNSITLNAVW